ncbi:response regulator [Paenibacillus xanthanilyticus]|uniref:Response regulator n=1 Tax=Paenibacillus xanthanilyticus TaxID=1783531 RepID=A0ABV8K5F2_9BACL
MIRVLVVDDEWYAVKGLRSGVNWNLLGETEVYEAYHAEMARELLAAHDIDIVICDIEMPEENGLQLMEWIRGSGRDPEIIVLTCHSEFSYAQKALQLGGYDYLLKPVMYADMEQVLLKLTAKIAQRRKADEEEERYRQVERMWESQKPLLVERFWQDVLSRRIGFPHQAMDATLAQYGIPLTENSPVCLILISVENWDKPLNERDEEIMEFALRKAAEETILASIPGYALADHRGNSLLILRGNGAVLDEAAIARLCETYIEVGSRYFFCKLSCYASEIAPLREMLHAYYGLLNAEYRNVNRKQEVIRCVTLAPEGRQSWSGSREGKAFRQWIQDWGEWTERGEIEPVLCQLDALLQQEEGEPLTVESLRELHLTLQQVVYYALHRGGYAIHHLYEENKPLESAEPTKSVEHFRRWAEELLRALQALLAGGQSGASPVVEKLKAYIETHIADELSREELAAHVYLNPAYLSRLFRKETGMVLTHYILQAKMRRAAEQLGATERSVSEIADSLGYSNFSYFARLFRKVYGSNPHDYRKSHRKAQ